VVESLHVVTLPGPGEKWTRLCIIHDGITHFALAPFMLGRPDPFKQTGGRMRVKAINYQGHTYVPGHWLETAFPDVRYTVQAWRALAYADLHLAEVVDCLVREPE
jgi:hypothetical protein